MLEFRRECCCGFGSGRMTGNSEVIPKAEFCPVRRRYRHYSLRRFQYALMMLEYAKQTFSASSHKDENATKENIDWLGHRCCDDLFGRGLRQLDE
jgi:hypothetical protein